jgi:hypothetical protein
MLLVVASLGVFYFGDLLPIRAIGPKSVRVRVTQGQTYTVQINTTKAPSVKIELCREGTKPEKCQTLATKVKGKQATVRIPVNFSLGKAIIKVVERDAAGKLTSAVQYRRPALVVKRWPWQSILPIPQSTPSPSLTPGPSPKPTPRIVDDDPYNWPIENYCLPVARRGDPVVIKDLRDGTYVYQRSDGTLFRARENRCRCLSAQTLISTPNGSKMIKDLRAGMYVYTLDGNGNKIIAPLISVGRVPVPDTYTIFHLVLSDNRELLASSAHPTADGRIIGELRPNDILDGARILKNNVVPYGDLFTYDILPAGDTGLYWANDILLKSTLVE